MDYAHPLSQGISDVFTAIATGGPMREKARLDALSNLALLRARDASARKYGASAALDEAQLRAQQMLPQTDANIRMLATGSNVAQAARAEALRQEQQRLADLYEAAATMDPALLNRKIAAATGKQATPYNAFSQNAAGQVLNTETGVTNASSPLTQSVMNLHKARAEDAFAQAATRPISAFSNGTVVDMRPMLRQQPAPYTPLELAMAQPGPLQVPLPPRGPGPGAPVVHTAPDGGFDPTEARRRMAEIMQLNPDMPQEVAQLIAYPNSAIVVTSQDENGVSRVKEVIDKFTGNVIWRANPESGGMELTEAGRALYGKPAGGGGFRSPQSMGVGSPAEFFGGRTGMP